MVVIVGCVKGENSEREMFRCIHQATVRSVGSLAAHFRLWGITKEVLRVVRFGFILMLSYII